MQTRYSKLQNMEENFITAAINAKDSFMEELWCARADQVHEEKENLTLNDAMEVVE